MTFITGKHLDRRTVLRGLGGAIALPLLDAMLPAFADSKSVTQARRLAIVYVPNGMIMDEWTPTAAGTDFAFKRILKPLEPFRDDVVMVSGMSNLVAQKAAGGGHGKATGSFLSACPPKVTSGADVHAGTTFDQVVARHWAAETRVPSLQLGCEDTRLVGNCDTGLSCAYTNCISWKNPDTPMAPDINPRSVFEQLFGTVDPSLPAETRARRFLYRKSILDRTRQSTQKLVSDLGAADRRKLDEYLTAVRDVEKQVVRAETETMIPAIEKPSGIPFQFDAYVKLMFDLQTIAFQADLTRVTTMMFGREGSVRAYPEIGVPDPHHPLTHHRGHPDFIEKVTKINCYHAELFAYFLGGLKTTADGDGTLLDHSTILYGSALADGNTHQNTNLPLLVAGHAGGRKGGRHVINSNNKEPVSNLFLTLMDSIGAPMESFGDSTSKFQLG